MLPLTNDCQACIGQFGQRHRLTAVQPVEDPEAERVYLCGYHDLPDPLLTLATLDPAGVLPAPSDLPQLAPKAPPAPPMTAFKAEAIIRRTDDLTRKPNGSVYPKLKCREVILVDDELDHRGLVEALYLDEDGNPMTAWLRDGDVAYVENGW